ncbi:MAG: outer membrane protein assembly factor BamD [Bryobacteraceae bacterium]
MMLHHKNWLLRFLALSVLLALISSCGFKRKKYENPITKDTQQPDKVLFDKAINDMERSRYEVARLTLQTLMNTYDTSEYLAKAKLAYADSWFREGGTHGLAQAEAEYKDFILFYPTLEESAEAQEKVCMIHFRQMEKADRDMNHALRAEDECRNLLVQFPNSKFAPIAQQHLREIQEVIAEGEMRRGTFYHTKGSNPAAANRLQALTDQYPLYSNADEANMLLGDSYSKMGTRFRQKSGDAFARVVREYPLSPYVDDAKKRLQTLELPVPEPDPVAYARMKYELENQTKPGMTSKALGPLKRGPDVSHAAKSGTPAMTSLRPTVPASVPVPAAAGAAGFSGDVTAAPITDPTLLETKPDARQNPPASQPDGAAAPAGDTSAAPAKTDGETPAAQPAATAPADAPLPTNRDSPKQPQKKQKKKKTASQ